MTEVRIFPTPESGQRSPEMLEVNPSGKVPAAAGRVRERPGFRRALAREQAGGIQAPPGPRL